MRNSNLYEEIPDGLLHELFQEMVAGKNFRLERIVSHGQSTPPGAWLEQDMAEWVLLLQGGARLQFQSNSEPLSMGPGDYVHIPAGTRHRVEWTAPDQDTVWLALHYR